MGILANLGVFMKRVNKIAFVQNQVFTQAHKLTKEMLLHLVFQDEKEKNFILYFMSKGLVLKVLELTLELN